MGIALAKSYQQMYDHTKRRGCIWEQNWRTDLWHHTFNKKKVKRKLEDLAALIWYHRKQDKNRSMFQWTPVEDT